MMPHSVSRGFTLLEMLVVLAIIGVILAITVTGQNSFNNSIVLSNTAYDIALSIRQAQIYSVSGASRAGLGGPMDYGYGVDVQSVPASSYLLFADTGGTGCSAAALSSAPDVKLGDCVYSPANDTPVQTVQINNALAITGFCVYEGATADCTSGTAVPLSQMDITFVRPHLDAIITAKDTAGTSLTDALGGIQHFGSACLRLSSGGNNRYIHVSNVGTIGVTTSCSNL